MNQLATTHSFAACSLASALLLSVGIGSAVASNKSGSTSATDPRLDMVTALQARGPHPTLGDQAQVLAIQDFWVVYPSGARKEREVYTDLRYYDRKSHTWPTTFIDVEHASIARFTGGAVADDRVVLDTRDFDDTDTRWSINDLRSGSFVWREEESRDGGKTWRLTAEHHMKRRGAVAPAP